MNTVIIPVLNESANPMASQVWNSLQPLRDLLQILFVDGGSEDATVNELNAAGFDVMQTSESGRGARLNRGLDAARGNMVLLHHPRSVVEPAGLLWFAHATASEGWGGFTHQFDIHHPFLRFTSWYSNLVRARRGILYLDHCIFAPRQWLNEVGGIPPLEIFEDTELSKRLLTKGRPIIKPYKSVTSSIRFARNGYLRQGLLNQKLKLGYYLRSNDRKMNSQYERGLSLNTIHGKKED